MKKIIVVLNLMIIFLFSCKTTDNSKPECLGNGKMDKVELRWGGLNYKKSIISGYKIDTKFKIYKMSQKGKNDKLTFKEIGKIDPNKFCLLVNEAQSLFLKIQALKVFADSSNFIEFINPELHSSAKAIWNSKFKTYGSKEFRKLFIKLDSLIGKNQEIYLKRGENPSNTVK